MVHVFDYEKGRFVQVHHFTIPPRASRRVSKRNRNAEYVKGLVQATSAPETFTAAESLQQIGLASAQAAEKAEEKKAAAEEEKARRQKAAEEEKRRQEEKAAERKKKQEEELEKKRLKEEEEQRRKAEAAEQKKQKEAAEAERKKQEKEEAERKKKEAEEATRKKKEEEAAARKKKEEEEAAQKKKEEEEAAKKKKEEEEAALKKKEEEEAARKKKEEEEAARKKKEEEEAAQKKKEEEAARKKKEEEAAQKKKDEEEAARKKKEEEEAARMRKEEEEEAARKKKEEEEEAARKKKEEEEAARKKEEEEAARKKKEEEEEVARKKKEEEEAARKKEEEEAARKRKEEEEEAARKKEEEEAAQKKKEEEEEAERKRVEAEEEEERRVEAAKNAAEDALADAAGGSDIAVLQEALEKAEAAGVDADSLEEARQRLTELEEEEEQKQRQKEEHDEAEDALATAAGGDDIKALESAIQRAEAAGCGKAVVEEAYERLLELKEEAAAAKVAGEEEKEDEEQEEEDWEKSGAADQVDEEGPEDEDEPVEAPKISATAYRAFEADGGSKMSASAPEFIPNQHSWTVNLAKTNPAAVKARRAAAPEISAASRRMPTYEKKDWILATVRRNTVTVISGDTGCGKSTLIPQLICDAESLIPDDKVIVCTQPRRIAAITLAQYVAADRKQELGDEVGYQIRFVNAFSEHTRLVYATTAIILRRLHSEPTLDSIGCLIVDEVHERDVYTDFVLLLLREAMLAGRMPHLKIVLMSATLKAEDFANYFKEVNGGADALKPIHIPGRMYAVEDYYWEDACEWLKYCPPFPRAGGGKGKKGGGSDERQKPDDNALWKVYDSIKACDVAKGRPGEDRVNDYGERALQACWCWKENEVYIDLICDLVHYFHREEPKGDGAILIFLPGWGDISKVFLELYGSGESFKLIALHSLMTPEQQQEAFEPAPRGLRKVVLSTNIAEASVTINDVVYVIDCGVRKERAYNPETGVSSLDAKMVTKANAIQRRGRAGRVQEGLVVHLFPSYKMSKFEEFPLPQMLTSSMDEVVLQSKVICGTANEDIAKMLMGSMAAPQKESITGAVDMLRSMDCLTKEGELTALGRACASIPVQPNVAKMLLMAGAFRCIKPAAVVAAFLSVKNPFQQSPGQPKGGGGKSSDKDKKKTGKEYFNKGFCSDHLTCLQAYVEWRRAVKSGKGDDFCEEQGLSPETMDMAHMMAQQFTNFMMEANYDGSDVREEDVAPVRRGSEEDALLKCALTAGFAPNFVMLYKGNRSPYWWLDSNQEVYPFGGSVNRDHIMMGKDGEEWMVYSDSMVMGRGHSIMDSSLVFSPFVLLFAKAILIDEKKGEIRFDRWWAEVKASDSQLKEIMELRSQVLPKFKETIEGRDLSAFPRDLTRRMAEVCMRTPISLNKIEPCPKAIDDEATGQARKRLSVYEWPVDEGRGEDDDE